MADSRLVTELVRGLEAAKQQRGAIKEISAETGVCTSTITKIISGSTKGVSAPNLERLWVALAKRGCLPTDFVFVQNRFSGCRREVGS